MAEPEKKTETAEASDKVDQADHPRAPADASTPEGKTQLPPAAAAATAAAVTAAKDDGDDRRGRDDAQVAPAPSPAPSSPAPVPAAAASSHASADPVDLDHLPGPDELPTEPPDSPAPPPGRAPAGDARSFRRADEFAVVYRHEVTLITRTGRVGTLGTWSSVEYPSHASAARAYALECSRLVGEGFRDYR